MLKLGIDLVCKLPAVKITYLYILYMPIHSIPLRSWGAVVESGFRSFTAGTQREKTNYISRAKTCAFQRSPQHGTTFRPPRHCNLLGSLPSTSPSLQGVTARASKKSPICLCDSSRPSRNRRQNTVHAIARASPPQNTIVHTAFGCLSLFSPRPVKANIILNPPLPAPGASTNDPAT